MSTDLLLAAAAGAGEATYVEDVFSTYLYTGDGNTNWIQNGIALTDQNAGQSVTFQAATNSGFQYGDSADLELGTNDFTIEAFIYVTKFGADQSIVSYKWSNNNSQARNISMYITSANVLRVYFATLENGSYSLTNLTSATGSIVQNTWHHVAFERVGSAFTLYIDGSSVGALGRSGAFQNLSYPVRIGNGYGHSSVATSSFEGALSNVRVTNGTAVYNGSYTVPSTPLAVLDDTVILNCVNASSADSAGNDESGRAYILNGSGHEGLRYFGPETSETEGKGGLVWIKNRDASVNHQLHDTENGVGVGLNSNNTNAEYTDASSLTAFNSNGFTVGSNNYNSHNQSGVDFASWTFAKQEKFFDVVTYTGTGSVQNISHNLGSVPGCVITKKLSSTSNWAVYHRGITSSENGAIVLNSTNAFVSSSAVWNNTAPTDSVFTVGTADATNVSGEDYVAYLFAHNDDDGIFGENGDQDIIKCGSYTGNGNADGPEIDLGFEPQWLLLKRATNTSAGSGWFIYDAMRGVVTGGADSFLKAESSGVESSTLNLVEFNATGFKLTDAGASLNASGDTYIYTAIRRGPMKTPESSSEVLESVAYTGDGSSDRTIGSSLTPDMVLWMDRDATSTSWSSYGQGIWDRLRGEAVSLATSNNNAESGGWANAFFNLDQQIGWSNGSNSDYTNKSGTDYVTHHFRRAPKFFDVVTWKGDGTSFNRRISHNLEQEPRLILLKARSSAGYNWTLYYHFASATVPHERFWLVNTGSPVYATGTGEYQYLWGNVPASTTDFGVGSYNNTANVDYVAYLFGASNIATTGLYLGNGTSNTRYPTSTLEDVRFLLIKEYSATSPWYVFDVERGIVAGNDPYLKLNTTDAEVTTADVIDPVPGGFTVNQTATENLNADGSYYLYYAVK